MIDKNKREIEILAPSGGPEHLTAAVRSGADAVYIGTGNFNARRSAVNFAGGALNEAVSYCHERGVLVYVTLNTLVFDDELPLLLEEVEYIVKSGADAVIVQDLAAARVLRDVCPSMPLHASTQMTVHNVSGVKMLERLGFSRAVLARELEIAEIKKIAENTRLDLEVFIHGALCMSVSGACYMSSMLGGRSGNRGQCAQPCRLNFKHGGREYALSLKDLSAIAHIEELSAAGVHSFKIEGRMKRPEYVAAAVDACRKAAQGEDYDVDLLRSVFSRGGFTDGYLSGKRSLHMFGYRKKEDVDASKAALTSVSEIYRRERQSVAVDARLSLFADSRALMQVSDGEISVSCEDNCAEATDDRPLSRELALKSTAKTGGTPYFIRDFEFINPNGMFAPLSSVNTLRREALELLSRERAKNKPREYTAVKYNIRPYAHSGGKKIRLRFQNISQVFYDDKADKIILPIDEIEKSPELIAELGTRLVGELPELAFPSYEGKTAELLKKLKDKGLENALADNIYGIELANSLGLSVFGGYGLNIVNTLSLVEYERLGVRSVTLSFETGAGRIAALGGAPERGIIGYGSLPLMKFRNCPVKGESGCGDCAGEAVMTDRMDIDFPLMCKNRLYTVLFNSVPLYVGDKSIKGIDFETLYFTNETRAQAKEVYEKYTHGVHAFCKCTNGLYFRTVE